MGDGAPWAMALDSPPLERFMKVLAIDTAGWECSVALWEDGDELSFQQTRSERDQAALLPDLVKDVMGCENIDQILVNLGPGSFTGIRVGIAFAKGLAVGLGVPLQGLDHFRATYLSLEPLEGSQDDILILVDARREDIYGQRFLKGIPQSSQILKREDLRKILSWPSPPLLSGTGVHSFLKGVAFQEISSPWRGAQRLAYGFFKDPHVALDPFPVYLKEADVTSPLQLC